MSDLADLAAHFGRVLDLDAAPHLVEPEPDQRRPLRLVAADRRSGLGDLEGLFLFLGHRLYSTIASAVASASAALAPPRPSRSATFLPRRWATERGLVCSFNASKVARIMLYGLEVPIDLVTTSATPRLSNTARIGPPAMIPVPAGAERTLTRPAPKWPLPSPTTTSAAKPKRLPPLTVFETRLMWTSFSISSSPPSSSPRPRPRPRS